MSFLWTALRGALAGIIGTYVMDAVTTRVQEAQSPADRAREEAARPAGQQSVENLVDLASSRLGVTLTPQTRPAAIQLTHYALGAVPGMAYALLRRRIPLLGAGRGAVYGLLLFALNDELMNTALGLSGPPRTYPASSHLRGLIGHVALGVTTDLALIGP
jgi:uncharacterized membrane protein YagU involved in acid resistance